MCINVILLIILLILTAFAFIYMWKSFQAKKHKQQVISEHFTNEDDETYKRRLTVMKMYETLFNRKPSPEEIDIYANYDNEQDMLDSIMKNEQSKDSKSIVDPVPVVADPSIPQVSENLTQEKPTNADKNKNIDTIISKIDKIVVNLMDIKEDIKNI